MVPLETSLTRQPWWVQTAVNALNCPAAGWVTTTFWSWNTLPPPTGTSPVLIDAGAALVPPPDPPPPVPVPPPPVPVLSSEPHPASVTATLAAPALASTVRRLVPASLDTAISSPHAVSCR